MFAKGTRQLRPGDGFDHVARAILRTQRHGAAVELSNVVVSSMILAIFAFALRHVSPACCPVWSKRLTPELTGKQGSHRLL